MSDEIRVPGYRCLGRQSFELRKKRPGTTPEGTTETNLLNDKRLYKIDKRKNKISFREPLQPRDLRADTGILLGNLEALYLAILLGNKRRQGL